VKRLALVLLVGILLASTGGLTELVQPELCAATESGSTPDGNCPPTCVRCHCARAFDLSALVTIADAPTFAPKWLQAPARVAAAAPHDILHVPKLALA
jgi:hypothetical protein